ncbi:MAG: hypothetical protein HY721_04335, partial [Planctomycetes bacterium]|nr:hypothetical protein [Planctomycetota bacterium]
LERAEAALEGASPKAPREKALFVGSAHHVANVRFLLGSPARAAAIHERCLRTIAGLDLAQPEAALRCSYGSVLLDMGRLREAHAELEGALGAAKRIGDRRTVCRARERMAESHLRRGDLKRALPIVEVCLEEAGAAEHEWASANGLRMLGRIHLKAGLLAEAGRALTRALDLHVSSEDRAGAAMTRVWLARLRAAEGKLAEAVALAEAARADARRHGMAHAEGLAALALAEAKLLESPPAALGLLEAAAGLFRAGGYLYDLCEARLSQARAALVLDRADAAVAALSEVAPAIEQVGAAEQRAELARLQAALAGAPVGG